MGDTILPKLKYKFCPPTAPLVFEALAWLGIYEDAVAWLLDADDFEMQEYVQGTRKLPDCDAYYLLEFMARYMEDLEVGLYGQPRDLQKCFIYQAMTATRFAKRQADAINPTNNDKTRALFRLKQKMDRKDELQELLTDRFGRTAVN